MITEKSKDFIHTMKRVCYVVFIRNMIIRNMSYYKIIVLHPTGLNMISKALIFVFLPLVENLTPSEPTLIPFYVVIQIIRVLLYFFILSQKNKVSLFSGS